MSDTKTWFIEVFVKKLGPSFLRAAIASVAMFMAAHAGLLTSLGIVYDSTTHAITLNLDTLSNWVIVMGPGAITALLALIQHHTVAAVNGTPQSGAHVPSGGLSTPPPTGA
jgi:hypothetical protein